MQLPIIFNGLLVALVVVGVEAASRSEEFLLTSGAPEIGIPSLLPEVLHPRSEMPIGAALSPRTQSTPKTRRMVYGWSPKSFENDNIGADQSDWALLADNLAETSEHPPKDKKISATTGTQTGPTDQPPPEVLKTLCDYFLGGNSKNSTSRGLFPPTHTGSSSKGDDTHAWDPSTGSSSKNDPGATGMSSMLTGTDGKDALAITWCNHQSKNNLSSDTTTHPKSNFTTQKNPALNKATTRSAAGQGPKNGPQISPNYSLDDGESPAFNPPKANNHFQVPSHYKFPST